MKKFNNTISNYAEGVTSIHSAVTINKKTKSVDLFFESDIEKEQSTTFSKKSQLFNSLGKQSLDMNISTFNHTAII